MRRDDLCHAVRQRLKRLPPPHDSHYGVVPAPPPEGHVSVLAVTDRLDAAAVAMGKAEALAARLHDPWLVSRLLPRREAVSSSAIEDTHSTLDELLSAEETDEVEVSAAVTQVRHYALALETLVPLARGEGHPIFTIDLVRDLHRAVMTGDQAYPDAPGQLRQRVAWIGGRGDDIASSTFNPPPPEDIEATLAETMAYMRCDGMHAIQQGLVTRMAVAHAHFEAVHPFRDGNGRVGRLLLPLMMAAEGHVPLYLSPFIEANREAYVAALKAAQQRLAWHELVGFLADAVTATVDDIETTAAALAELRTMWRARRKFRAGSAAAAALDVLPDYPVITIGRLAALLGVSFPATSRALAQLMEAGIVQERTGYRRNRVFAAGEVLALINRPFGSPPERSG